MKHTRHLTAGLVAVVLTATLAACADSQTTDPTSTAPPPATTAEQSEPAAAAEGIQLTMWARSDTSPFMEPLVNAYNASHDNQVALTLVPAGSSFTQKLGAALATNSGPDIISLNLVYAPYFAQAEQLYDITDMAQTLGYLDQLNASEIELGTWDGRLYEPYRVL
jgi:multiple sugar transport system substrate-binding protein